MGRSLFKGIGLHFIDSFESIKTVCPPQGVKTEIDGYPTYVAEINIVDSNLRGPAMC